MNAIDLDANMRTRTANKINRRAPFPVRLVILIVALFVPKISAAESSVVVVNAQSPTRQLTNRISTPKWRSERSTCYQGQLGPSWMDTALSQSSILLKTVTAEGRTIGIGTGTIIRNSGDRENPHNRVLTAYHVVYPDLGFTVNGLRTIAVGSDGTELGEVSLVSRAYANEELLVPGTLAETEAGIAGNRERASVFSADIAVLALKSGGPAGWTPYDRRPGLELSKRQSAGVLTGLFSNPGGLAGGVSGAGVVDDTNQIIGVILEKVDDGSVDRPMTASVSAHNLLSLTGDRMPGFGTDGVIVPKRSRGFAVTVTDKQILSKLNIAGRKVKFIIDAITGRNVGARLAAYPLGNCVVYSGLVEEWFPQIGSITKSGRSLEIRTITGRN